MHILGLMQQAMPHARQEISQHAPRLYTFKINPDKIRDVIGKGGVVIRGIQEETGTTIEIEDDGTISIACVSAEGGEAAKKRIQELTADVEVGKVYEGTVLRLLDFGAIVQLLPGRDGLLHISQISHERVNAVSDHLKEGQQVKVKVLEADDKGRVRLSMKAVEKETAKQGYAGSSPPRSGGDESHAAVGEKVPAVLLDYFHAVPAAARNSSAALSGSTWTLPSRCFLSSANAGGAEDNNRGVSPPLRAGILSLLRDLPLAQLVERLAVDAQGRGRSRFQALQADLDAAAVAVAVLVRVDARDRFVDLLDELALPIPVAQLERHVRLLARAVVRIGEHGRLVLHRMHGAVDLLRELGFQRFQDLAEVLALLCIHVLLALLRSVGREAFSRQFNRHCSEAQKSGALF